MILQFSYLSAVIFLSWLMTSTWVGLGSVLIGGAVLFSDSIPTNILLLILHTFFSFLIASGRGRKDLAGVTQWYYTLRLFFLFVALFGVALHGMSGSSALTFVGLLLSLPLFIWSFIFSRHFEGLTTRAYVYSAIIQALATLNVLLKIKDVVEVDCDQWWDITLTTLGIGTFLVGTTLAFLKKKTKALAIYLTQAWIGLALFVLVVDAEPTMRFSLAALSSFIVTAPFLLILSKQIGPRTERFARVMLIGMPGFLGFSMFYYSIRSISTLNIYWLWVVAAAFLIQVLSLMVNQYSKDRERDRWIMVKFSIVVAVQLGCSIAFFFLEKGGKL